MSHRRRRLWPASGVCIALLWLLSGCVGVAAGAQPVAVCSGQPRCPIELRFSTGMGARDAVVEGGLSPDRPSMSYAFDARARGRLQWSLRGPAVRVTLAAPDGDVIGPGVPAVLPLRVSGRYVLSVSSNTMAEGIYGPFRLEVRLLPPD
jgi:hypothetical protein